MPTAESPRHSAVLTVSRVIEETDDARSLVFDVPDDEWTRFQYRPGQFLTLRIPSDRTGSVARCYSLASSPHTDEELKVTVKRTVDGYGSNWLCDNVTAGDSMEVLPPSGVFSPHDLDQDFLPWAAGSGITPIMSILKSVLVAGAGRVVLIYANRDECAVIFGTELLSLAGRYPERLIVIHWLETLQGLPSTPAMAAIASQFPDRASFICGPAPFMDAVQAGLAEAAVPRAQIHREVFTSLRGNPFVDPPAAASVTEAADADAVDVEVLLDGDTHRLRWPRDRNLVEVMISAGIDVPYSCREGQCGSCAATVVEGRVEMGVCDILEPEDIAEGLVLTCQARPLSDPVRVEF